jgi:Fe-S-cluster-containing hydrogenase component 2
MFFVLILPYLSSKVRYTMAYVISDACTNCATCDSECPVEAIAEKDGKRWIDKEKCVDCGACSGVCPIEAITGE